MASGRMEPFGYQGAPWEPRAPGKATRMGPGRPPERAARMDERGERRRPERRRVGDSRGEDATGPTGRE